MSGGDDGTRATASRAARPPWSKQPCPPWCTREHAADDHPEDRYHQSEPSILPVVAGAGDAVPVTTSLRALTLAVRLGDSRWKTSLFPQKSGGWFLPIKKPCGFVVRLTRLSCTGSILLSFSLI